MPHPIKEQIIKDEKRLILIELVKSLLASGKSMTATMGDWDTLLELTEKIYYENFKNQ